MRTRANYTFIEALSRTKSGANALLIALMVIIATSLILKVFVWMLFLLPNLDLIKSYDSFSYDNSARALLEKGNFAISPELSNVPQTMLTPGYPIFLASVYAFLGYYPGGAILAQIFVSLGTIIFVFLIARSIWGSQVGLLACLLLALDIVSFGYSLILLTETLFTFLVVVFLGVSSYQLIRTEKTVWTFLLIGSCLGLATMVRPVSYYLVIPVGIGFTVWMTMQHWNLKMILLRLAFLVLPFVLIVGGWQLRNHSLTGSSQFSQVSGVNMLFYRAAGVVMLRDGISKEEARLQLTGSDKATSQVHRATAHPEEKLGEKWQRQGLSVILSHPLLYARSAVPGALNMMLAPGDGLLSRILDSSLGNTGPLGDLRRLSFDQYIKTWVIQKTNAFLLFLYASLYLTIVYVGVLSWMISWLGGKDMTITTVNLLLLGVLFYFLIISAGFEAYPRFRVVIMPILVLCAAKGLSQAFLATRYRLAKMSI